MEILHIIQKENKWGLYQLEKISNNWGILLICESYTTELAFCTGLSKAFIKKLKNLTHSIMRTCIKKMVLAKCNVWAMTLCFLFIYLFIFDHFFSVCYKRRMELRPLVMCFALCVVYATSKPTEKKDRVHHDEPLSNREHDDNENFDYDHEAFLGQEEAKTFDQLTPEESKERLG